MADKISIIYVNYNSSSDLLRSIKSLENISDLQDSEIIVVANDDEKIEKENIRLIANPANSGFGSACNLGAQAALGDILWFLNPDTEVVSGKISHLMEQFQDGNIGIIGPKLMTEDGDIQPWSAGHFPTITSLVFNNLGILKDKKIWLSQDRATAGWVSGTSLFTKKEAFQRIGGFDEKFFMYFEDVDLCKRMAEIGFKSIYYPEFIVKHFGGKSFKGDNRQKKYYYASQDRYFSKHHGRIRSAAIKILRKLFH